MAKIYTALAAMALLVLVAIAPAVAGTFPPYPRGHCGAGNCYGTQGDDTMIGTSADEGLHAGVGNDTIEGNKGQDRLKGGSGRDDLRGGYGDDALRGGRGLDKYTCGGGNDVVYASARERHKGRIADDCESVKRV